jgi:metal-responsive CopG/Arc/MetJ family transcriptional regulator
MASVRINITLPSELLKQIDEAAAAEHRSRSEYIREATRRYLTDGVWERYQRIVSERARSLGIQSEADVERLIDEYRAERRGE